MTAEILTPEWSRIVDDVTAVFLPGTLGPFEVLRGHAAIISTLEAGTVIIRYQDKEERIEISSGVASVRDDVVKLCVEIR